MRKLKTYIHDNVNKNQWDSLHKKLKEGFFQFSYSKLKIKLQLFLLQMK